MFIFICDKDVSHEVEKECLDQISKHTKRKFSFISPSLNKSIILSQDYVDNVHEWWLIDIEPRGSNCSISGKKYEIQIYDILKNVYWNGEPLNSQNSDELGGSSNKNDIVCNYNGNKNIGIEVKKLLAPDWGQCSLKFNKQSQKWVACENSKNSPEIFNSILSDITIFNNKVPPFIFQNITHDEWTSLKKQTNDFNDVYIDIPPDTIRKLYSNKQCYYIQISEKGLYHLGNDIYQFDVPELVIEQQLRIRTKVHSKSNSKGFCQLSVMASCIPKNIKNVIPSPYSLDKKEILPKNIREIS